MPIDQELVAEFLAVALVYLCLVFVRGVEIDRCLVPTAPQTAVRAPLQGIRPDRRMIREH